MLPSAEIRTPVDLQMRVWGMSADGRAFIQHARACNISLGGALLSGIERNLNIGDTIGVQHGAHKARCKVVWTLNTQTFEGVRVGVQLLSKRECPWTSALPKAGDSVSKARAGGRRWARHKISVVMALHHHEAVAPMRVTATDISASGCYVETIVPRPIGTCLNANLWISEEKLTTPILVRTSDPGVGMGIEFVGLKPQDQQRFQDYLKAMNPWGCSIEH
jgi:hypothetical protein